MATAPIGHLAWEPPYAMGVALEKAKRRTKKSFTRMDKMARLQLKKKPQKIMLKCINWLKIIENGKILLIAYFLSNPSLYVLHFSSQYDKQDIYRFGITSDKHINDPIMQLMLYYNKWFKGKE